MAYNHKLYYILDSYMFGLIYYLCNINVFSMIYIHTIYIHTYLFEYCFCYKFILLSLYAGNFIILYDDTMEK